MGVNATIFFGSAVVINPTYLTNENKEFFNTYFRERDIPNDLVSVDSYTDVSSQLIVFWAECPQTLFPGNRRPLVINMHQQLLLMTPEDDKMSTDDPDLWGPSYSGFHIQTLQYSNEQISATIEKVQDRLRDSLLFDLLPLVANPSIQLVGKWLVFFHH